jgi:hypothetical protein
MINLFRKRIGVWPSSLRISYRYRAWMTRCSRKLTVRSRCSRLMKWNCYHAVFVNLLTNFTTMTQVVHNWHNKFCERNMVSKCGMINFCLRRGYIFRWRSRNSLSFFLSFPLLLFLFCSSSYLCSFFYFHSLFFFLPSSLYFPLSLFNCFLTSLSISSFAVQIYVRRWINVK